MSTPTQSKWTPGPWIVRDVSDAFASKHTVERITDGLRSVICRLNDVEVCPEHGGTGSEANARLIAAAPQLLEALKLANELLDNSDVRHYIGHDLGEMSQLHKALNTARAALAAAQGTSNRPA